MRVLHVSQPVEAGVPNVVLALAAHQRDRGGEVHVACPAGPGLARRAGSLGAEVHPWPSVRSPGVSVPVETRRLRRIVSEVDPDVVVLHSAKAGLAGRLALRGSRPTVYVPHAWSFEAVRGPVATASTWWEVAAGRWTDLVVCVSEDERRRGREMGVSAPMEVVPNGVDVESRSPRAPGPARRALDLPDVPTVVCVGRLARQKGQDLLLACWPEVLARVPGARLVLVGDGPDRAALEAAAPPGVRFTGTRSDVDEFLAAADVVALPSRWESTPLVALEAMAAGRPAVAFEVDGVRAAFGDTGVVLAQDDVSGLARALGDLLADPAAARAAGRAARERVVAVGDLRTGLKAWNGLLAGLVGGATWPAGRPGAPALWVRPVGDHPSAPAATPPVDGPVDQPAASLARALAAGVLRTIDVAEVAGSGRADTARALTLSALGIPVWWRGGAGVAVPRALGAPVLTGAVEPEALARAARRPGAGLTGGPPVSVVVTVLNEGAGLGRLVEDLLPQLCPGDELVIVDGGSTDGSVDALRAVSAPALRVHTVPGAGISAGRNHGVRLAGHDVIICTDAGCVPGPGFVDGFRRAFATADPPALVSGVYTVLARNSMERAQQLACYPQPDEVRRPTLLVRAYTRLFGTGFDPRFAVGRCVAFTRAAWEAVGGFPEHLATGEDVSFGLAVAQHGACVATTDAVVGWTQRDGVAATWRMYRGYGRASTDGGDPALLVRDGVRGLAYLVAPLLLGRRRRRGPVAAGALAYLSLPLARAARARAPLAAVALLPVAMAVKDLGKLAGAAQGGYRAARARGNDRGSR